MSDKNIGRSSPGRVLSSSFGSTHQPYINGHSEKEYSNRTHYHHHHQKRLPKTSRPSLQLYKPPGLRSAQSGEGDDIWSSVVVGDEKSTKPSQTAGSKQSVVVCQNSAPEKIEKRSKTPTRKTKSEVGLDGKRDQSPGRGLKMPSRQNSFIKDASASPAKKTLTPRDLQEVRQSIAELKLQETDCLAQFLEGGLESAELANGVGQGLVRCVIEQGRSGRGVARLCGVLLDCPSGVHLHGGLVACLWQYFECRDKLRSEHFKYWLSFLNFVSDLYSAIGFTYEGELVDVLFRVYEYMLQYPILDSIKIEELECVISSLLSVGYDLERQCPDQLSSLRDFIRNAFILAHEPWSRKMILLLVELSASGWKLPSEAHDYYFQTHSAAQ